MDDSFQELVSLIKEKAVNRRALVISADDINLESERKNTIYLLELGESNAAGGRAGGFGQRNVTRITCFDAENDVWIKLVDIFESSKLKDFESPHYAATMSLILPDSSEAIVAGVVDQILVKEYNEKFIQSE
ncbi:MAG: hypothetical protein CMO12_01575 [Thaumarchaeota archaeon]|jgi:hypothetical protein|nr:hypothetical protein [Nitrososphaerota archaeon]|tara:strand:- start:4263 stop:4658 length:396 start_codon:yes stop_codon:yes gene_type:complete